MMSFLKTLYFSLLLTGMAGMSAFCDDGAGNAPNLHPKVDPNLNDLGNFVAEVKGHNDWANILIPLSVFAMVVAMVWLKHRARVKIAQTQLEAIKILAEKGQPLPEGLMRNMNGFGAERERKSPGSKAVSHMSLGLGFIVYFFFAKHSAEYWAIGVGAGFLVSGLGNLWVAKNKLS